MSEVGNIYKIIKKIGINISQDEYADISIVKAFNRVIRGLLNAILLKYCMYSVILSPLNYRLIRSRIWRLMGCHVGKNVFIGYDVWMDYNNSELIYIEDGVHIANRCLLLCHQRDLSNYYVGDDYSRLAYKKKRIYLKKGCLLGMGTMVMPGVTIGEGSIIGAGSIVTCDIPEWTIAVGRPAKVIKKIPQKENEYTDL
ncbi:MAG: acyltransferase [Calditrichaceae bacterium]|nr:acyltransferase [Calditrichaceae bacterium]